MKKAKETDKDELRPEVQKVGFHRSSGSWKILSATEGGRIQRDSAG